MLSCMEKKLIMSVVLRVLLVMDVRRFLAIVAWQPARRYLPDIDQFIIFLDYVKHLNFYC